MKRLVWSVLFVFVLSLVVACGDDGADDNDTSTPETDAASTAASGQAAGDPIVVAATTTIIADLARNVAGERATITSIIPTGADPHDFGPTPADIEEIADAELVLEHGQGYDEWAHDLVEQSGTGATVIDVTDGIELIAGGGNDEHEDNDQDHGGQDPHVWFDVANVQVMTVNIRDALIAADPDGSATYEANTEAYLAELDELDGWIHEQVATIPEEERKLVTSHEAFGYYVVAYGFEYVGAVVPSLDSQAQASAQQIDALLDLIEAEGVRAVFTETTVNPDLTEQIAAEAGVKVVTDLYSDSLSDDGSQTDNYIGMMRHNTTAIVEALT